MKLHALTRGGGGGGGGGGAIYLCALEKHIVRLELPFGFPQPSALPATRCLLHVCCRITIRTVPQCAVEGAVREGVGTATAVRGCSTDCRWNQLQPAGKQTEGRGREGGNRQL